MLQGVVYSATGPVSRIPLVALAGGHAARMVSTTTLRSVIA
jgi:hypothetical protein